MLRQYMKNLINIFPSPCLTSPFQLHFFVVFDSIFFYRSKLETDFWSCFFLTPFNKNLKFRNLLRLIIDLTCMTNIKENITILFNRKRNIR